MQPGAGFSSWGAPGVSDARSDTEMIVPVADSGYNLSVPFGTMSR
jgi:hypothetical protein